MKKPMVEALTKGNMKSLVVKSLLLVGKEALGPWWYLISGGFVVTFCVEVTPFDVAFCFLVLVTHKSHHNNVMRSQTSVISLNPKL